MKLSENNSLSNINPIQDYVDGSSINKVKEEILSQLNESGFGDFYNHIQDYEIILDDFT